MKQETKKEQKTIKYFKETNAITLIALVITIIVLLILAAVSIATLTGENGILTRANEAKTKTEEAAKKEEKELGEIEDFINEKQTGIVVEQVTDSNPGNLEGNGTESDPYVINSIEDLIFFAYDVTNGNTYAGEIVKLGLSLDFNSNKSYIDPLRTDYAKYGYNGELKKLLTTGKGFSPIGIASNIDHENYSFAGVFDGNGKIIANLYQNMKLQDNENDLRQGLFGNNYGTIKNLGLVNCNIQGSLDTTGNNTAIIGGIVGFNYKNIDRCFISGSISGIGTNNAKVRIGGIVGTVNGNNITNCYNTSNINCVSSVTGNNATTAGGLIGYSFSGQILNCYNIGNVKISTKGGYEAIGGIIGWATNITVNSCYNISQISLEGSAQNNYAGGIVGRGENINLNNCYNIVDINSNSIADISHIGQIAGTNYSEGVIKNCYYYIKSKEYSSVEDNEGINESEEINQEKDMPDILNIVGDAFKESLYGYPILNWQ